MKHLFLKIIGVLIGMFVATGSALTGTYAQELNIGEAIDNTMAMLESQPNDPFLRGRLMKLHFVNGAHMLEAQEGMRASESFMKAIRVAFDSFGAIPETDEVVVLARYGLAHTANDRGMSQRTVSLLEEMLMAEPDNWLGRYMLGVVLMSTKNDLADISKRRANTDFQRGGQVMRDLWRDSTVPRQFDISETAAQLTYERALGLADAGDIAQAIELLRGLRVTYGSSPSTVRSENYNIRYALVWMAKETGDEQSALAEIKLILKENPDFMLPDGTPITPGPAR